tara:strand:+ start:60 stop:608 length:549 start_codon:yes stop_codon:yes gene_type:complete
MVDLVAAKRIPTNIDYASPTQFRLQITRLPNVEYFIVAANIPDVSFSGEAEVNTPFKTFYNAGDILEYGDLTVKFMVNESLENWEEIYNWIKGIGFPHDRKEYPAMIAGSELDPKKLFSEATLTILTNKNNPVMQVVYKNLYPSALTGIEYDVQQTDTLSMASTATFKFSDIELRRIINSTT